MNQDNSPNKDNPEGGFYKGLFYGVVLGLGLVWFLGTKEGKKVKTELLSKGEDLLNEVKKHDYIDSDEDESAGVDLPPFHERN